MLDVATMRRTFSYADPFETQQRMLRIIRPRALGPEVVQTSEAFGRILAKDIVAETNIPERDCSLFDGFAVRAEDTYAASTDTPTLLKVKAEIWLGERASYKLGNGETCKIPTGGFLPKGANAVVMEERVVLSGRNLIQVHHPLRVGESVSPRGEDIKEGERILRKGRVLRAQDIGVLAALGIKGVQVVRRPRISIISSGTELVEDLEEKENGKVLQSHSHIISKLVEELGGTPIDLGIAPDDLSATKEKILQGLKAGNMLITIGGCSVGDRDYVPDAVNQTGEPGVIAHGIRRRPGRVSGIGFVKGKPVVMLPGHIQSAIVGFHLFAIPLIRRMSGFSEGTPYAKIRARISEEVAFKGSGEFEIVVFVALERELEDWVAKPIMGNSSLLKTLVEADGFLIAPLGKAVFERGEEADVNLIPGFSRL